MIKFIPLGGANEIGASSFYLNISGTGILLDCGIDPRKTGIESLPNFNLLNDLPLDFVFISHAHQDHIGALPFLVQKYPHVVVYTTIQTKEIAETILHNSANILYEHENENAGLKIYTHEEIDLLVRSMIGLDYKEVLEKKGLRHFDNSEIKFSFHDAGHILGAASILIEYSGKKILYTGDINISNQTIMISADLSGIKNIDTLILESTYGSTDSAKIGTWKSETARLVNFINQTIHHSGSVLIPAFALGKTQEILNLLYNQMRAGKLTDVPIFTGGVARDISNIYDKYRYTTRRSDKELVIKNIPQKNIFEIEDLNYFKRNPCIALVSSGMMLPATTSFKFLNYWLTQKNFSVAGVGYMDEKTPGYRLMNSKKGEMIQLTDFSQPLKVECNVDRFYFPSHSKREDLLDIVSKVNPKRVIIIHGDEKAKNWVGNAILEKYNHIKVYSAQNEITIPID